MNFVKLLWPVCPQADGKALAGRHSRSENSKVPLEAILGRAPATQRLICLKATVFIQVNKQQNSLSVAYISLGGFLFNFFFSPGLD